MADKEYLVQRESLESIADEIRVLSGATEPLGLDEMATHVSDANTDVETMTELIEDLEVALEGKSVGGDSGASVETFNLTVVNNRNYASNYCEMYITDLENGPRPYVSYNIVFARGSSVFASCVKGTIIVIVGCLSQNVTISAPDFSVLDFGNNAVMLYCYGDDSYMDNVTITISD